MVVTVGQESAEGERWSDLEYFVEDLVATIRLNRPGRKNSLTIEMIDALSAALHQAEADDEVRCVVLTGADDSFCVGIDLDALDGISDMPYARVQHLRQHVHALAEEVLQLRKPLIGAINGAADGAGMDLALMCDVRWASRNATVSEGYIRLGLIPDNGGCHLLPRLIGTARALELMWTGDHVGAADAAALGIFTRVCEADALLDQTYEFARRLAAAPMSAAEAIKRATYQSRGAAPWQAWT